MKIIPLLLMLMSLSGEIVAQNTSFSNNYSDTYTKVIYVQHRGHVTVPDKHFKAITLKKSSFVKGMYYDEQNSYLIVRLNNKYYNYCAIPGNVVERWVNAPSLGRFYNGVIKGHYSCKGSSLPKY